MFKRMICAVLCLLLAGSVLPFSALAAIPEGTHKIVMDFPEEADFNTSLKHAGGVYYAATEENVFVDLIIPSGIYELDHWETTGLTLTEDQKIDCYLSFEMPDNSVTLRPVLRERECPFVDVPGDSWYYEYVMWAQKHALLLGTAPGLFSPYGTATRAQSAATLRRICGSYPPGNPAWTLPFLDVAKDSWYYESIHWCYYNEIVKGVTDIFFEPNSPVTRAQFVTMLYGLHQFRDREPRNLVELPFVDVPRNAYYREALSWAVGEGIVSGKTPTTFKPYDLCTRAEVVSMIYRYFEPRRF